MKRAILSTVGLAMVLVGCQKKETAAPASPFANFPSRQFMQSKIRKGMSFAEVKSVLGSDFSVLEDGYVGSSRASDGALMLYFQNDRLVTIISSPLAKGTMKENRSKIQTGMSQEDLWIKVGYPDRGGYVSGNGSETFTYYLSDGGLNVSFEQGKVKNVIEMPGAKNDIGMQ